MKSNVVEGYKIEDIPAKVKSSEIEGAAHRGRKNKYPLFALNVGKGFFVPRPIAKVSPLIHYYSSKSGRELHARSIERDGKKGTFIYRTKSQREVAAVN